MSNVSNEVYLASQFLYQTLAFDAALISYATGGVWRGAAPALDVNNDPLVPPWVVFAHQGGPGDVVTMNAFRLMDDLRFQVVATGPTSIESQIASAAVRIDQLIGSPPTSAAIVVQAVTLGQVLAIYRESPLLLDETVNGKDWVRIGGLYRMLVQQAT